MRDKCLEAILGWQRRGAPCCRRGAVAAVLAVVASFVRMAEQPVYGALWIATLRIIIISATDKSTGADECNSLLLSGPACFEPQ